MEGQQGEAAVCPSPHHQHRGRDFPFVSGCKPAIKPPDTGIWLQVIALSWKLLNQRGSPEEITRGGSSWEQPAGGQAAAEPSGALLSSRVKFLKLMNDAVQALPHPAPGSPCPRIPCMDRRGADAF